MVKHVALIGLPGAGKSTVAEVLARRWGVASADLDREIERLAGRSVSSIFSEEGEERFRDLESRALAQALEGGPPLVLACGGGILGRIENRVLLKARARVVWLGVDPGTAAARLQSEGERVRPLLRGGPLEERLRSLLSSRREGYAGAADQVVQTGGLAPEEVADRIAAGIDALGPRWDISGS